MPLEDNTNKDTESDEKKEKKREEMETKTEKQQDGGEEKTQETLREDEEKKRKRKKEKKKRKKMEEQEKIRKEEEKKEEKEKIENALEILNTLKLQKRSLEDSLPTLKEYLDIKDTDILYSMDKDKMTSILTKIQDDLIANQELLTKPSLEPLAVIKRSSALGGIYFTRNVNDWEKSRSPMVDIIGDVYFKAPCKSETRHDEEFHTMKTICEFNRAVDKWGFDFAAKVCARTIIKKGGDLGYGYEKSHEKSSDRQTITSENTYNKTSFSVVPVVLWEPTLQNIVLTKDAKVMLEEISSLLAKEANETAKHLVEKFFDKFGSHVYIGKSHFGGTYKIETTYHSDVKTNDQNIKKAVQAKHSAAINAAFNCFTAFSAALEASGSYKHNQGEASITKENEENIKVTSTISKSGGPLEVYSASLWKKGLIANNSTWVTVSSGEPELCQGKLLIKDYKGVWELVLNEASFDWSDALKLARFLLNTWKQATGFDGDASSIDSFEIQQTQKNFKKFIDNIKEKKKANQIATLLMGLCNEVAKIKKVSGCHNLWEIELCSNEIILDLLKTIIRLDGNANNDVRYQTEQLLQLTEINIFPCKAEILFWLHPECESTCDLKTISSQQIKSVEEFLNCLDASYLPDKRLQLSRIDADNDKTQNIMQEMNVEIALSIAELLNNLKEGNDNCMYIFFVSLALEINFDITENVFNIPLTIQELTSFKSSCQFGLKDYYESKQKGSIAEEAYVCHKLLKTIKERNDSLTAQCLYEGVYQHTSNLNIISKFHPKVKEALTKTFYSSLSSLEKIVYGEDTVGNTVMWKYFETRPTYSRNARIENDTTYSPLTMEKLPILDLFNFTEYYPGKLTIKHVLTLGNVNKKDPENLPWLMLKKIMSADFQYREQVLEDFINCFTNNSDIDNADNDDDEDDDDLLCTTHDHNEKQTESQWEQLSPTDVFLAIFQCCDPFLKQFIVQRISVCQFAVPYFYTDLTTKEIVLSIFPLRDVFYDSRSECVATASLKTVSFIRIGNGLIKSKSKIINELLRKHNEEHSTFFHRDCPRGMTDRTFSNGLIEASWYVPRQEENVQDKTIAEPLTVLNLRGDAAEFVEQTNKIILVSNIIIIFIKYEDLKNEKHINILKTIHNSNCLVLLLTDATKHDIASDNFVQSYKRNIGNSRTKLISTFDMKQARQMNANELTKLLQRNMILLLKTVKFGIILQKVAHDNNILTDETSTCIDIEAKAKLVYQQIQTSSLSHSCQKQTFTPLQCEELWQKWSAKLKEQKRRTNQTHYDTDETLLRQMHSLRKKQVETCNTMPDVVANFVQNLLDYIDDNESINYFLFFFRQYLDNDSKIIIPKLQNDFRQAFEEYEKFKTEDLKRQVNLKEKELAKASFGIEHFFREIGQIYEAFMSCQNDLGCGISDKTRCIMHQLPITVAKLLLLGHPLELMDGDAANVPLEWITAVFEQLKQLLDNSTLISISVLGIQSSGKSTLLNTMFGLRFAVSAGRCTRGLFAQLLPVNKTKSSYDFDYAMIIDAEGLRAPELATDKINHDNELATFVIGLADTVIINIKGETIADMENVLQIVVHGLLRLKQANTNIHLQHRCMFVHQNVSAEDARSQMLQGNKNTMEKLDIMTKEVAIQEGVPEVLCFKDVIDFDQTKDVRFLPDLWTGTRPMAPASTIYSLKAIDIGSTILNYASNKRRTFLNVENKKLHLKSLWDGILSENFVFSFRNCLEVKAYSQLESELQSLLSVLDLKKLQWMAENIKPRLFDLQNSSELDAEAAILKNEFKEEISETESKTTKRLQDFIDQSELSEIMVTWKQNKLQYITFRRDAMEHDVQTKITHEFQQRLFSLKSKNLLSKHKQEINITAQEVALKLQNKPGLSEEYVKIEFEKLWITLINKLIPASNDKTMESKDRILACDIIRIVNEQYRDHQRFVTDGFKTQPLENALDSVKEQLCISDDEILDYKNNISTTLLKKLHNLFQKPPKQLMLDTIHSICLDIDETFDSFFRQDTCYDISQLRQIISKIKEGLKKFNESGYAFTPKFEVHIALRVARHSYQKFKTLNREYEKKHGMRSCLMAYKPEARQLFDDICRAKSTEIIAINMLCGILQKLVIEHLEEQLPLYIQGEFVGNYVNQKGLIIKMVLTELAEKNDFEYFMHYIRCPQKYIRRWITKKVQALIFDKEQGKQSKYEGWIVVDACCQIKKIVDAIQNIPDGCSKSDKNVFSLRCWINKLIVQLKSNKFSIGAELFQHITEFTIDDNEFNLNIIKELNDTVESNIKNHFLTQTPKDIKWLEMSCENIFDTLWGCTAQCPICGEPCQKFQKNHGSTDDYHTCIQHRPSGINGTQWRKTNKIMIENCNFQVQSNISRYCGKWCKCPHENCQKRHPHKEYKSFFPDWDINPSTSNSSSLYWIWFMNTHKEKLAAYYQAEMPDIPPSWARCTKEEAIKSLSQIY